MTDRFIYKILLTAEYNAAMETGLFTGVPIDHEDGYLHFSRAQQTAETLKLYFGGRGDVYILQVDTDQLDADKLVYETSRGGDAFPHYYGHMAMAAVLQTWLLPMQTGGGHDITPLDPLPAD